MDKKEISARTSVKAIITGFVSYGIITIFISLLVFAVGNYLMKNISSHTISGLYITLPLMASIIIYFIVHAICKLSTYDVFNKCKTNPKNYKSILNALSIFYVCCIVLSIVLFLSLLYLNLQYQLKSIEYAQLTYKAVFSDEHIQLLTNQMTEVFNESKTNLTRSTIILELGFSLSLLSLIPYQKKMLDRYNKF